VAARINSYFGFSMHLATAWNLFIPKNHRFKIYTRKRNPIPSSHLYRNCRKMSNLWTITLANYNKQAKNLLPYDELRRVDRQCDVALRHKTTQSAYQV